MLNTDVRAGDSGTQSYATRLGSYDEMYAAAHKVLPHWERFLSAIEALGSDELERRSRDAQRLLRDNGVTYNVYGDADNLTRPWRLDPIPLLIGSSEWSAIEAGLKQRAELLDLILKDIYGPQQLIKKGLLPIELVFGHQGFLHPCVKALSQELRHLIIYSANLARGPDGRMWVLDDRSQAPSGFGYALENRTAVSRVLPEVIRDTQVRRLSAFFKLFTQGLAGVAPRNRDNPRIVLLTPGPFNETYFEHAFLAAYLGFTLVQGDDLTVRDGRVWLKSVAGLQPVDVIWRRLDDSFSDPLELRSESRLGVAGLLEAVRRGNVAVANPLGSSVLENPGLLAFLPGLCRYHFGQDLLLDSVATWWCGQQRECDFVLKNLDDLVIKQINRRPGLSAVFGAALSKADKAALKLAIKAKPYLYVGQERVSFSTAPSFIDHRIEPRNAILRCFVVAHENDYAVMPGGLTRIAREKDELFVSNQSGGMSKDTWVLSSETEKTMPVWPSSGPLQFIDADTEPLTSRAADNLFWVGRYLERVEATSRLFRNVLLKIGDTSDLDDRHRTDCLAIILGSLTHMTTSYPGFVGDNPTLLTAPQTELLSLARDGQRTGSLTTSIQAFYQAALNIRDLWSQDTWRTVDAIHGQWQQGALAFDISLDRLQIHLDDLINGIVAFTGLISESMTREAAWLMLDSGRRLERALNLISLLRSTLVIRHEETLETQVMESLLISTDSLAIYLRRYRSAIHLPMVLDLLMMDERHPRSMAFQLAQLSEHIRTLPHERRKQRLSEEERLIFKAYTNLRLCNVLELLQSDEGSGIHGRLENLLSETGTLLQQLANVIAQAYFSHSQASQLMSVKYGLEDEL